MEWKEVKLGDIADMITGYPFKGNKYSTEGIRVVRGDNVTIGRLRWDTDKDKRWNEPFDKSEYYQLREKDIVIGMDGSRVGKNKAQIKKEDLPLLLAQRVACVRNNSLSIQDYLYYQIFSKEFTRYVNSIRTGSAIPHISLKQIQEYPVKVPSLDNQKRISNILSSLDHKIEINDKINGQLEEMAQAIFRNWFVDFEPFKDQKMVESELGLIPEGWKVGKLSDVANITMGQSPAGNTLNENGEGIIFYQGCRDFTFRYPDIRIYTTAATRYAEPNSVLFSVRAPVGAINRAETQCCIGRGIASIKAKKGMDSFVYYLVNSLKHIFDKYNGEGTVFGSINKKSLEELQLIIPPVKIRKKLNEVLTPIDTKIESQCKENQRLASLRDTLLPKLMSGEIEV